MTEATEYHLMTEELIADLRSELASARDAANDNAADADRLEEYIHSALDDLAGLADVPLCELEDCIEDIAKNLRAALQGDR